MEEGEGARASFLEKIAWGLGHEGPVGFIQEEEERKGLLFQPEIASARVRAVVVTSIIKIFKYRKRRRLPCFTFFFFFFCCLS